MGNGTGRTNGNGRARRRERRRTGEHPLAPLYDCLWDFSPAWLARWWLNIRLARLRRQEHELREAAKRSVQAGQPAQGDWLAARWQALEEAHAVVDRRRSDLHHRTRTWSPMRRMRAGFIGFLLLGLANSYLDWLSDVLAVAQAFSLAVAVKP